jgi:hypothetical protein
MKSNVVKLRPEIEFDESELDVNQIDFDGGDGGSKEIVIRIIHEYPEIEEPKYEEPKSNGIAPFIYGALFGWWLGG